jgi:hypothetical protein
MNFCSKKTLLLPPMLGGGLSAEKPASDLGDPGIPWCSSGTGKVANGEDVPFFYTIPTAPRISKPSKIKGSAEALDAGDWSPIEKLIRKEVK